MARFQSRERAQCEMALLDMATFRSASTLLSSDGTRTPGTAALFTELEDQTAVDVAARIAMQTGGYVPHRLLTRPIDYGAGGSPAFTVPPEPIRSRTLTVTDSVRGFHLEDCRLRPPEG
jgi:hypothetical protein